MKKYIYVCVMGLVFAMVCLLPINKASALGDSPVDYSLIQPNIMVHRANIGMYVVYSPETACINSGGSWLAGEICDCSIDPDKITEGDVCVLTDEAACISSDGTWNDAEDDCTCLTGFVLDGNECVEEEDECVASGGVLDGEICECSVDDGLVKVGNVCVPIGDACEASGGTWDPDDGDSGVCECTGVGQIEEDGICINPKELCQSEESGGVWNTVTLECVCGDLKYEKDGVCHDENEGACVAKDGDWSDTTGCSCDIEAGLTYKYGTCQTPANRCDDSDGVWESNMDTEDDLLDGECFCDEGFVVIENVCVEELNACEDSNGLWKNDQCYCPSGFELKNGTCVEEPESTLKGSCEDSGGVWLPTSKICECGASNIWDGGSCIPSCGKDELWNGSVCASLSDEEDDKNKLGCNLSISQNIINLWPIIAAYLLVHLKRKKRS